MVLYTEPNTTENPAQVHRCIEFCEENQTLHNLPLHIILCTCARSPNPPTLNTTLLAQALVGAYLAPALGLVTYVIVYALHDHDNPLGLGLSCAAIGKSTFPKVDNVVYEDCRRSSIREVSTFDDLAYQDCQHLR